MNKWFMVLLVILVLVVVVVKFGSISSNDVVVQAALNFVSVAVTEMTVKKLERMVFAIIMVAEENLDQILCSKK